MAIPASVLLLFIGKSLDIKALILEVFASLFIGGIFCIWAEKQGKKDKFYIWQYSKRSTLGKKFLGVELEDFVLFLILTPIFCVAMWEFVKKLVFSNSVSFGLILIIGVVILCFSYLIAYRVARPRSRKKRH